MPKDIKETRHGAVGNNKTNGTPQKNGTPRKRKKKTEEKKYKGKWTIMIYMAVDDANGIPESKRFLEELKELGELVPALKDDETENRDFRIVLQAYTDWGSSSNGASQSFGSRRYEVNEDFDISTPLSVKNFNSRASMGEKETLSDFIEWSQTEFEAEKYLLFLWGHGSGSSLFKLDDAYDKISSLYSGITIIDRDTGIPITSIDDLTGKNSLFNKLKKKQIRLSVKLRGNDPNDTPLHFTLTKRETDFYNKEKRLDVIYNLINENVYLPDDVMLLQRFMSPFSNLDALLEREISECLKEKQIDLLLIMGCCMQMVEFGYELHNPKKKPKDCFYYVASEELIYFDGYNYKSNFTALSEDPNMTARELAERIVKETVSKSTYADFQRERLAISAVDLTKSQMLADKLSAFADAVIKFRAKASDITMLWEIIADARSQCRHFGEDAYTSCFIDVTWFFKKFYELISPEKYTDTYKKLVDIVYNESAIDSEMGIIQFLEQRYIIEKYIGQKRTVSSRFEKNFGGHGVAIFFPSSKVAYNNSIANEAQAFDKKSLLKNSFTRENKWADFIEKFFQKVPNAKDDFDYLEQIRLQEENRKKISELQKNISDLREILVQQELDIKTLKDNWGDDAVKQISKASAN